MEEENPVRQCSSRIMHCNRLVSDDSFTTHRQPIRLEHTHQHTAHSRLRIFGTFLDKLKMVENLERAELNRRKAEVRTVGIGALRAELELRKLQIENLKIRKETSGRETLKLLEQQEIQSTVLTDEYKVRSLVARKTSLVRISAELSHQAAAEAVERVARGLECTRKLLEHSTNELVQARKQLEAKNERMTELDLRRMCGFRKKFRAEDQLFWPTQMERKRQTKRQDVSRGVDFTRPP